ncbi:MAG: HEAT repeat domain-containing protein [Myxococcota bacterium]
MGRRAADDLPQQLQAIRALADAPDDAGLRTSLRTALRKKAAPIAARAAAIVQNRQLTALVPDLVFAFERFLKNPVKRDPSCEAKRAILQALDRLDHDDPELFIRAARLVQLEPAWGPPVDTAVPVRARAALAIGRIYYPDATLILSELLCDDASAVQRAAIESIAHRGDRAGAGLLWMRIRWRVPDEEADPLVRSEAITAFVQLAPDYAAPLIAPMLYQESADERELVAFAMATSRTRAALDVLLSWWEQAVMSGERGQVIDAIAAHRTEAAHRFLRDLVMDGAPHDAKRAIQALARQAFTEDAQQRLLTAAQAHPDNLGAFAEEQLKENE